MAIDGILLFKINQKLNELLPARLLKINNISDTELIFQLKSNNQKINLLISLHSQYNRLNITTKHFENPLVPSNFVMLLRKYLENGIIKSIEQFDYDRYLKMTILGHNELGENDYHYLFIELMGKYANLILVDSNMKIMDALKRIPPFENANRTIQPGAKFTYCPLATKKDPLKEDNYNFDTPLFTQFSGFSPLLSQEIEYRLHNKEVFKEIIKEIIESDSIYVYQKNNQIIYHTIPLKHLNLTFKKYELMSGLDEIYSEDEQKNRLKQNTGDLFKVVKRELKKNINKKDKLKDSLDEANDLEKWRIYGDLLFANIPQIKKGMKEITLLDFYSNQEITIPLDPRLDGKTNAKKCFQKYNKYKNGQIQIQKQIEICQKEIDYFENILSQLNIMDLSDANEVRDELINYGYLKDNIKKKRKKEMPLHYLTIKYDDDTFIFVGKNNKQNDYLTFKKARKDDLWFHVLDYHGSHTILQTSKITEEKIRICAMLAAYYSEAKESSSIAVSYTQIKNLKKVADTKMGFVTMSQYKTIYIDIDKDLLNKTA